MARDHIRIKSFTVVLGRTEDVRAVDLGETVQDRHSFVLDLSHEDMTVWVSAVPPGGAANQVQRHVEKGEHFFVLGDGQDLENEGGSPFLGNGLVLQVNTSDRKVDIRTSLTGLPAAFLYRDGRRAVVASDIQGIAAVPGIQLQFDPRGLTELATIGHPINHRTLFKNVSIVPAGVRLKMVNGHEFEVVETWTPSGELPFRNWPDYIEAQVEAMKAAVRRLDLSHSFLSLTAGLDTRAIFALLIQHGVRVPAFTMSGERESLDARRARQLCRAYGFPHSNVSIDSAFVDGLPAFAAEASRLSGGLGGLGQAFEVYFYKSIPAELGARISGNLGNQIGRSGTEGTGTRNASLDLLHPDLRADVPGAAGGHWFREIFPEQQMMHPQFLIQNENLYASLGNYCIGSHFALQQTPYADRTVIVQKLRQPPIPHGSENPEAIWRIKLRDLRHRILGQPVEYSFQRRIVKDTGDFVANCPINWGWRARGGVSLTGLVFGGMALTDAVLGSRLGQRPIASGILRSVGILGFSGFQAVDILGKPGTRQFVADTLLSSATMQGGILNKKELERLIDSDCSAPQHRTNLEFALDVALTQQNFLRLFRVDSD